MPAPTVTVNAPQSSITYSDENIRPEAIVKWSGATGPTVDVLHEWDDDIAFGSPIQDNNTAVAVADPYNIGVPPSDLGPAGTTWYYRVTVKDNADAQQTTSATSTVNFDDRALFRRYLYQLADVGAAFYPTDFPGLAGGPDDDAFPADGYTLDFRRYLFQLADVGAAFYPIDFPTLSPGPADDLWPADGYAIDFRRYLYELADVGAGFYPTDGLDGGPDPVAWPADGDTIDFQRYLYQYANATTDTPTPHIWYLYPTYGREGWEFKIIGYGFGDTQATFSGSVTLNALAVGVTSWELVAAVGVGMEIDPAVNLANPVHQLITATVPAGATSGPVIVCTDGP